LPFLKFPADPPGIGDDVTLRERAALYLASLLLIVLGSVVAIVFTRLLELRVGPGPVSFIGGLAVLAGYSAAIFLFMPGVPDPPDTPLDIVQAYRAASVLGLAIYWAILGAGFALQVRSYPAPAPPRA